MMVRVEKDKGWSWIVLAGSFLSLGIIVAYLRNAGIFFVAIQKSTEASSADVSWISTSFNMMQQLFTPVAMVLVRRFGPRPVVMTGGLMMAASIASAWFVVDNIGMYILTLGVLAGFGTAFCFTPTIVSLSQYFERRIGLAMSVMFAGASIGHMALAPLLVYLIDSFGLRSAILIMGGITLNITLAGSLYFTTDTARNSNAALDSNDPEMDDLDSRVPERNQQTPTKTVLKKLMKMPCFYALVLACCCQYFIYLSTYKYIPAKATDIGMTESKMAYYFSISAFVDLATRVVSGLLLDLDFVKTRIKRYRITTLGLLLTTVNNLVLALTDSEGAILACVIVHATACGIFYSTIYVSAMDLLEQELYPLGMGITDMSPIVLTPADSLLLGPLRDHTGSYRMTFIVLFSVGAIGTIAMIAQKWLVKVGVVNERPMSSSSGLLSMDSRATRNE